MVDGTLRDDIGLRDNINTCYAMNSLAGKYWGRAYEGVESLRFKYTLVDRELRGET